MQRAAALGLLDADAVGRELSADQTASGQLHAEAALAGMPDAAVKGRTWLALTGGDATNAQARAMGRAFWQSDQDALLGRDGLPVGLRRVVLESRDDLARAVRCASMPPV